MFKKQHVPDLFQVTESLLNLGGDCLNVVTPGHGIEKINNLRKELPAVDASNYFMRSTKREKSFTHQREGETVQMISLSRNLVETVAEL